MLSAVNSRGLGRTRSSELWVWSGALAVVAVFLWIVADLVGHGLPELDVEFFTEGPRRGGREGGIFPILVSTVAILGVCMATAVPIGLGTALLLAEFSARDHRLGLAVRRSLDVLAAVPSIVFGLFGNAFFCKLLGLGFSILSGGLTLACMVLPIFIRTVETALRAVPVSQRWAGEALGMRRMAIVARVVLPQAAPGIAVGLILGIGRALAETAALIFTSGAATRVPTSVFDSGRALSIHIYMLAMNVPGGNDQAYGSAIVLIVLLFLINQGTVILVELFFRRRGMDL